MSTTAEQHHAATSPGPRWSRPRAAPAAWADAARLQRWATPDHADFYALAGEMVATLHALDDLAQVCAGRSPATRSGRTVYDDTRAVDPQARLGRGRRRAGTADRPCVQAAQSPANAVLVGDRAHRCRGDPVTAARAGAAGARRRPSFPVGLAACTRLQRPGAMPRSRHRRRRPRDGAAARRWPGDRPRNPLRAADGGGRGGGDAVVRRAARPRPALRVRPRLAWLLPVVVDAGAAAGSLVWLGAGSAERGAAVRPPARARAARRCRSRRTRSGTAWPRSCCCRRGGWW